jgi:hypothetical protein
MSSVQNSKPAGASAGRVPSEEVKAELIAAIESGAVIGALMGNRQEDVKLQTAAGQWQVFGGNVLVLVLGEPLGDEPGVHWLAAD